MHFYADRLHAIPDFPDHQLDILPPAFQIYVITLESLNVKGHYLVMIIGCKNNLNTFHRTQISIGGHW